MSEYYRECLECSFEENDITATAEQIECVAADIENAAQLRGMYEGTDCIPNPMVDEVKQLRRELKRERNASFCEPCQGTGRKIIAGVAHYGEIDCWNCRGKGKIYYD